MPSPSSSPWASYYHERIPATTELAGAAAAHRQRPGRQARPTPMCRSRALPTTRASSVVARLKANRRIEWSRRYFQAFLRFRPRFRVWRQHNLSIAFRLNAPGSALLPFHASWTPSSHTRNATQRLRANLTEAVCQPLAARRLSILPMPSASNRWRRARNNRACARPASREEGTSNLVQQPALERGELGAGRFALGSDEVVRRPGIDAHVEQLCDRR